MEKELSTKPNFIVNKDINTVFFCLVFKAPYRIEDLGKVDLLRQYLFNYSKECPDEESFRFAMLKHLVINFTLRYKEAGENTFIYIRFTLPKEGIVENYSLEESLAFIARTIFEPFLENDSFEEKRFIREKDFLYRANVEPTPSIYTASFNRVIELLDPNEEVYVKKSTYIKCLENLTKEKCYAYYKEYIKTSDCVSYVYGHFDEEKMKTWMNLYFPQKKNTVSFNANYFEIFPRLETEIVEEQGNFNQTALYMVYDIEEYRQEDRIYLCLLHDLLCSGENDLVFNVLREKNHLVYSSRVTVKSYCGLFMIETYLNIQNKEKAIELIKQCLNSLQDEDVLVKMMKKNLKGVEVDLLRKNDHHSAILDDKITKDFNRNTLEDIYEAYKKISVEEMKAFLTRVHLRLIYVLKESEVA